MTDEEPKQQRLNQDYFERKKIEAMDNQVAALKRQAIELERQTVAQQRMADSQENQTKAMNRIIFALILISGVLFSIT
jgi:hypothetical protein